MKMRTKTLTALLIFAGLLFGRNFPGQAQIVTPTVKEKKNAFQQNQQQPEQKTKEELSFQEVQLKLMEQAFEKPVDPKAYIVGPGDIFSVVIWGDIQKAFQIPVTAEGKLVIPTIGTLSVAGQSLKDVKEHILKAGRKKYRKARVSAYLMGVRKIRVYVTGEVTQPGSYVATPLDRVSDVLSRAGGFTPFALNSKIEIIHRDGKKRSLNYNRFLKEGDLQANPFLLGGDMIFVPPVGSQTQTVTVLGQTDKVGLFPIQPKENLFDFLVRRSILTQTLDVKKILVTRKDGRVFQLAFPSDKTKGFMLTSGDVITIAGWQNGVYVRGAVRNPGEYPFSAGRTALDYVGMAGGMEKAGSLGSIRVFHAATKRVEKGPGAIPQPGDMVELPETWRARIISYFQIASSIASVIIAIAAVRNVK